MLGKEKEGETGKNLEKQTMLFCAISIRCNLCSEMLQYHTFILA